MPTPVIAESVTRAVAQAVSGAWGATPAGAPASIAPGGAADGRGWTIAIALAGAATGRLRLWFEHDTAVACATRVLGGDTPAADEAVVPVLLDLVQRALAAVEVLPDAAGVTFGDPDVSAGTPSVSTATWTSTWADLSSRFAVETDLPSAAAPLAQEDSRLEAVLDVELPLIVRFGRAIMPLRAVADLSPGSVVDMGRSPDEPVELLVGERLIARGEVVIVGGNYGVRITELTSGRRTTDLEVRS